MTAEAEALRVNAIRPALEAIGLWSPVAENLVLGTAAHESGGFKWRRQLGGGPALSFYGIEPKTDMDEHRNFLKFRPVLAGKIDALLDPKLGDELANLELNDRYGAALCRLKYYRSPARLPADPNDVFEMGRLWASVYNTRFPAQLFIDDYRRYVEDMTDAQIAALKAHDAQP